MIRQYVDEALRMARYDKLDGGTIYGEVPRLRGVMATASTLKRCREQLAEVIEEWVLIRVAKRLPIPRLGKARSASKDPSRAASTSSWFVAMWSSPSRTLMARRSASTCSH